MGGNTGRRLRGVARANEGPVSVADRAYPVVFLHSGRRSYGMKLWSYVLLRKRSCFQDGNGRGAVSGL